MLRNICVRAGTKAIEIIRDEGLDPTRVEVLAGALGAAKIRKRLALRQDPGQKGFQDILSKTSRQSERFCTTTLIRIDGYQENHE